MSRPGFYITTPIYYVNGEPHIGHAYTSIISDIIARFFRLAGREVKFLTGTDEHGQKVQQAAQAAQMSPSDFAAAASMKFRQLSNILNLSNDDFIRTTEPRHFLAVQALWQKLLDSGNIYLGKYQGWYSVRDEAFYYEQELTPEGLAPSGSTVEWVEEPSYFFKLSVWQDQLLDFYSRHPDFIRPTGRYKEVINFVRSGLHDLSVSRTSFDWGIPIPGDEHHVMYVWLDALTNYLTAAGYPDSSGASYQKFWPADLHVIGKDILRFHAVYWPAFLMAAELPLPQSLLVHGWWTNDGQKISKSLGNVIDPVALAEEFGEDALRYFLIRSMNVGQDGDFTRKSFISRVNTDLGDKIGNLVHRTLVFIAKNAQAQIPVIADIKVAENESLLIIARQKAQLWQAHMQNYELYKALEQVIELAEEANAYIDAQAPWKLRKTDVERMCIVLYTLLEAIHLLGVMLQPFTPKLADNILRMLAVDTATDNLAATTLVCGRALPEPEVVFIKYLT